MPSTSVISVNVEEEVKKNAQRILSGMGLDLTAAIDNYLRTIIMEADNSEYIKAELEKAKIEAADPNTVWLSHEEIMARAEKRFEDLTRV